MSDLETARGWYAEELRYVAAVKSPAVVRAFATVPRERFLGPGPWLIGTGQALEKYWTTENADPRCVYHNVVIGMLPDKGLNNGQPSFWAFLFDRLELGPGRRVLHLGCGAGYYTAVLAELVGPTGHVTGIDIEEELVARAREALVPWPQAEASCADGAAYEPAPADTIVVSAGATHLLPQWLDALSPAASCSSRSTWPSNSRLDCLRGATLPRSNRCAARRMSRTKAVGCTPTAAVSPGASLWSAWGSPHE